jgi:HAD superfamily hydrolase (TIGR01509 family)
VSSAPATARAVIFDCDGVLFDSWHANVAYYNAIRARLGLPSMSADWERQAHYLAASSVLEEMFGHEPATLEEARRVARIIDYEPFYELMVPVPGLFDVLASLRPSWRLGMATNRGSTVPEVVRRFGLDAWLDAAAGVLDVARPKPHPDVILECLARLVVPPDAAVYVGDAESDVAAAAAAGVHFIAVGEHTSSARVVRDLREVPALLDVLALEWC